MHEGIVMSMHKEDRQTKGQAEGVAIVDVAKNEMMGIGATLDEALAIAREVVPDVCPYCDCGRDEQSWYAYMLHPYSLDLLKGGGYGDRSLVRERVTWDHARQHLRWISWPDCLDCLGKGYKRGHKLRDVLNKDGCTTREEMKCEACRGNGMIDDPEEDHEAPSWYVPVPKDGAGSIWRGKRSRCLDLADEAEVKRKERYAAFYGR